MSDGTVPEGSTFFPGPDFHVNLPAIDALHPVHYGRRLLIFRCVSNEQRSAQLTALKAGLQALVRRCPILGGTVIPQPPNEKLGSQPIWRKIEPGNGLELVVRDLRTALPSFAEFEAGGFQPAHLPHDLLVPIPRDLDDSKPFAACKIQYSAFEGGTVLTWGISHSVTDGSGNNELTRVLSEQVRLAGQTAGTAVQDDSVLGLERSPLRSITTGSPFKIEDHPGYAKPPVPPHSHEGVPAHPFEATSPEVPVVIHITASNLVKLKADAALGNGAPISTHDALAGLLWRSTMLIRSRRSASAKDVPPTTSTTLFFPSDARKHINVDNSYIGNAVYQLAISEELGNLLSPTGLQYAASAIRRAIIAVTPDRVTSLMSEVNKRWVDWAWATAGTLSTTGIAMGTNWTSGAVYLDDWGEAFGPVIRFRYPGEVGSNAILPKLPDGAAEVMVSVGPSEVDILKGEECFGRYLS
ncbi:hypothetical protein LTR91_000482 [Friedmanniomyces endolithicus]|uniref:Trichothecene 3-O-acetyltransferase-like N-terminal domain-containing protein n=1 Tax=Friedmanniomyces endolithicus TaxID=329885 RepID=A0AAN6J965_9PEZI|nr:hypothetical protein LTS09_005271 [Friedmanniomyces endolithicus]KAK0267467.1 hypothetical protein LTR35_016309 [Friedmanniomyces endolithicus]KAK0285975.1 hypothetical protein LTS00_010507 [Friedmanniomyces endolithicus]KAK0309367.1 hypothetical protein LTR01_004474 [Friedmanniomyces endolithicus]KAK0321111.1 hypothetical protein LTR82_008028 [Friedmanniomyces endolithicus]